MKAFVALLLVSFSAVATVGHIDDFNYQLTDIADTRHTKEKLFSTMFRDGDLKDSICANRAHVWGWDFLRRYNVRSGKIFIFFGESVWANEKKGWMYHVAPYIVENGQEFVMEAGYPKEITKPLSIDEWLENETDGRIKAHQCLEIFAKDEDLTQYFYERYNLPERREAGKKGAVCYFRKVPGHYWYPTSIALHDLKKDDDGDEVKFNPKDFDTDDVLEACIDFRSSRVGRWFGGASRRECRSLFGL